MKTLPPSPSLSVKPGCFQCLNDPSYVLFPAASISWKKKTLSLWEVSLAKREARIFHTFLQMTQYGVFVIRDVALCLAKNYVLYWIVLFGTVDDGNYTVPSCLDIPLRAISAM